MKANDQMPQPEPLRSAAASEKEPTMENNPAEGKEWAAGHESIVEWDVQANGPLSWAECLKHLSRSDAEIMHRIADGRVRKAVLIHGQPIVLELSAISEGKMGGESLGAASADKGGLAYEGRPPQMRAKIDVSSEADAADGLPHGGKQMRASAEASGEAGAAVDKLRIGLPYGGESPEIQAAVTDYVREWFGLDENLQPFYEMAQQDAVLAPVVAASHGLRLIGIPDLFEALAWSIIGQQISLGFAYTMKKRLVETYGEQLPFETAPGEAPYLLFPRPERLAALTPDDLRPLQFSSRKAEYIIGIARLMEEGSLSKSSLLMQGEEEARQRLLAIRGVGAWTADYVGMKCLRSPSAFPLADAGLHQALRRDLKLDRKPLPAEILQTAASWHGHEAYATFYLWHSLL